MSSVGKRLKQVLTERNISQQELASMLNTTQGAISNIVMDKTQKPRNLLDIANILGLDPNWLQNGTGSMTAEGSALSVDSVAGRRLVQSEPDDEHYHELEYLDVRAAAGGEVFENSDSPDLIRRIWLSDDGMLELVGRRNTKGLYIINVPTDSMEPTIPKGSMVVLDVNINYYNGDGIYAFSIDGNLFIKRIQKLLRGGFLIISDNKPKYRDEEIENEYLDNARFVGKFVRVWKIEAEDL